MRIVSWNCQGGLRKKIEPVLDLTSDILVIQECEQIKKILELGKNIDLNSLCNALAALGGLRQIFEV